VRRSARVRKLAYERLELRPEHEPAARDHAFDRGADVRCISTRFEIEEWDQR
jgi:hypothetical protein